MQSSVDVAREPQQGPSLLLFAVVCAWTFVVAWAALRCLRGSKPKVSNNRKVRFARNVATQSQTTYTSVMGSPSPRFNPVHAYSGEVEIYDTFQIK